MELALILSALLLALLSGIPGLVMAKNSPWGQRIAVLAMMVSMALGFGGLVLGVLGSFPEITFFPWPAVGDSLIGLDPPAVAKLLGPPSTVAKGEPSLVWTYIATGCTFRVFFYPDLKTASFHALKYGGFDGNGEQIGLSQTCIRNILTARVNGSG